LALCRPLLASGRELMARLATPETSLNTIEIASLSYLRKKSLRQR
jgi:hypothetical protein